MTYDPFSSKTLPVLAFFRLKISGYSGSHGDELANYPFIRIWWPTVPILHFVLDRAYLPMGYTKDTGDECPL